MKQLPGGSVVIIPESKEAFDVLTPELIGYIRILGRMRPEDLILVVEKKEPKSCQV
jgi:hypothetical protein